MAFLGPNNALAWAHFRLRGGWQRTLTFTIGAIIVLAMLIIAAVYSNPIRRSQTLYGWTTGLLALQALIVLYIMGRVLNAIRVDIQSHIIESHRLMPTPSLEAIAGYISGAALQPLVLGLAIFIVGIFTAGASGSIDISRWALAHFMLLAFGVFIWTIGAYASWGTKFGPGLIFVPLFVVPYAAQGALAAVPGLLVLLNPIVGDSIFDLRTPGFHLHPTYAIALATQGYFGVIFFIAAARKYRSADSVGIDTALGLLLVAGWTAITCLALYAWEDYRPRGWNLIDVEDHVKVITSLALGMLIALAPVAASAWARARWRRHQLMRDPAPLRRPVHPIFTISIATILILLIPFALPYRPQWIDIGQSALILLITLAGMYFLCAWVYAGYPRAIIVGFVWILLMWATPVIIDLVRYGLADYGEADPLGGIATASPIGALVAIWSDMPVDIWPGIGLQFAIACIPLTLRVIQVWRMRAAMPR